jgi:hypothetical protein
VFLLPSVYLSDLKCCLSVLLPSVYCIYLIEGGGAVEVALSVYLEGLAGTMASREQLAIAAFAQVNHYYLAHLDFTKLLTCLSHRININVLVMNSDYIQKSNLHT